MKHKNIAHAGIIEQVTTGQVMVRIQPQSACGNCHSSSQCSMSDSSGKLIDVSVEDISLYSKGQHVTLFLKESLGYRALILGYVLPFLILLFALIFMVNLTGNDGLSALVAIGLMFPYYAFLYYFRENIRRNFEFVIK